MNNRSWISERIFKLFPGIDEDLSAGAELIRRRRLLDFAVSAGNVMARIHEEGMRPMRIELQLSVFEDMQWERIFSALTRSALPYAALLAGEYPSEVEESLVSLGLGLVPQSAADIQCSESRGAGLAAVLLKFSEKLENDPFTLFALRGRGREETLSELSLRQQQPVPQPKQITALPSMTAEEFYTARANYRDFSYLIRADELPAALLKRLDPVPDADYESEHRLEDAYAQVARRAQVYGLGIRK